MIGTLLTVVRLAILLWPIISEAIRQAEKAIEGSKQGEQKRNAVLSAVEIAHELSGPMAPDPSLLRSVALKLIDRQVADANAKGELGAPK